MRVVHTLLVLIFLVNISLSFKLSEYFGSKRKYSYDEKNDLISLNHQIDQCKIIHVNLVARYV